MVATLTATSPLFVIYLSHSWVATYLSPVLQDLSSLDYYRAWRCLPTVDYSVNTTRYIQPYIGNLHRSNAVKAPKAAATGVVLSSHGAKYQVWVTTADFLMIGSLSATNTAVFAVKTVRRMS